MCGLSAAVTVGEVHVLLCSTVGESLCAVYARMVYVKGTIMHLWALI